MICKDSVERIISKLGVTAVVMQYNSGDVLIMQDNDSDTARQLILPKLIQAGLNMNIEINCEMIQIKFLGSQSILLLETMRSIEKNAVIIA